MKTTRTTAGLAPALFGLFTLLLAACDSGGQAQQNANGFGGQGAIIPAVEVVRATVGTLPLEERVTGRVIARNQTEIYPEAGGLIVEVFVENGDEVKAGDPLVRLRDTEFSERYQQALSGLEISRAQSAQARATLDLVESQYQRTQSLVERNLENNVNLETARSQLSIAQADLDLRIAQENQAKSLVEERLLQLQNATIKAPISGTIGQRSAEVGQLAGASSRLFVIGELSTMRVELLLSDRMLAYIDVGVPVSITSTSWPDEVLNSSITRISPFLDSNTMRTQAFVELGNPQNLLRPGMFVTVDILYGQSDSSIVIPNSALYRHPRTGLEGVYVVTSSGDSPALAQNQQDAEGVGIIAPPAPVSFVPVQIVATGRMATGVRGIQEGDMVVTVGQQLLQGGAQQVRPRLLPWDHMMHLQELQSEDMIDIIEQARAALSKKS